MAKKEKINFDHIIEDTLESIFADRFSRYSKYVIQDRALPDARDGLKPVQRRVIFAMSQEGNTFDKPYRKSAKTVGNVIGNYHPHGDSSVYEAMVRMTQEWKSNEPLVTMHGNNGSIDGDSAAAMRYTEAKLSLITSELVEDINKDTVKMAPNFDDTILEPTVLPAKFPNLLVNGANGISSGYATTIPPHNLGEVVDATLLYLKDENITPKEVMKVMPGPDFPTGGIIQGKDGILKAYTEGKGKIIIQSKIKTIEKNGKISFIVKELPFEVNKANLVRKIDEIVYNKKIEGIEEVRDESDRDGMQIAIDLTKDANSQAVLNYLLKNTDLQVNFNLNMIAIKDRRPELLSITDFLKAFVDFRVEVITNRSEYDLARNEKRLHIAEGLKKAISVLDEIIKIIRASSSKQDAKINIQNKFNFTEVQAEAIVMMQLYRLSNTDITQLIETINKLESEIQTLKNILASEEVKKEIIYEELSLIKEKHAKKRQSKIEAKVREIEVRQEDLVKDEEVMLTVSRLGYVKRSSLKSFMASDNKINFTLSDYFIFNDQVTTKNQLMILFSDGTYIYLPVYEIKDSKWKDKGFHISEFAKVNDGVSIVGVHIFNKLEENSYISGITKNGYITYTPLTQLISERSKNKIIFQKVKKDDFLVNVNICQKDKYDSIVVVTKNGQYLKLNSKVSATAIKNVGSKIINLAKNDEVVSHSFNSNEELLIMTNQGSYLRIKNIELPLTNINESLALYQNSKANAINIVGMKVVVKKGHILIYKNDEIIAAPASEFKISKNTGKLNTYQKTEVNYITTTKN